MTSPLAVLTVTGSTALIELADPERRNVLSHAMVDSIVAAVEAAEADERVRCLVLTGRGSAFCAGAELEVLEGAAVGEFEPVRRVYDGFLRVLDSPLVSIAAVNGPAVGAGLNLALACDVRLASRAARFDARFAQLRLHPGGGHTWLMERVVGHDRAVRACLFQERWDADQALAAGLVTSVHEVGELTDVALAFASRLDGLEGAFTRRLTETLRGAREAPTHREILELETVAQQWSMTRPPFLKTVRALRAAISTR